MKRIIVGCGLLTLSLGLWAGENLLMQNGYVLDLQGNQLEADGSIVIGAKGILVKRTGSSSLIAGTSTSAVTVIAEVSDIPQPTDEGAVMTLIQPNVLETYYGPSFDTNPDGAYSIDWNHNRGSYRKVSATKVEEGTHRLGFVYQNNQGSSAYLDGTSLLSNSASSGSGGIRLIRIGEYTNSTCVATGLRVKRLAVVDASLTAAEIAAYDWSEVPSHYARFTTNFANRVLTYTASAGSKDLVYCSDQVVAVFDPVFGAQTTFGYNASSSYTNFPGCTESTRLYRVFCNTTSAGAGYSAPGLVLRYPTNTSTTAALSARGGFSPINLGGLIVENGASPAGLVANIYDSETENRTTHLGDARSTNPAECFYVFKDDFDILRNSNCSIYGIVNLEIAEGKTFKCSSPYKANKTVMAAGAKLKLNGAGTFEVQTLEAKSATLDFTGVALDRSTPYISGNLTINSSTKFIFPAGFAAGDTFQLCSGTVSGTPSPVSYITVGTEEKLVAITISGNQLSYAAAGAVVDGVAYATAQAAFDAAKASSTVSVYRASSVTLSKATELRRIDAHADLTIGGEATLTLGFKFEVDAGVQVTVDTPVVISGCDYKAGAGGIRFNNSFSGNGDNGLGFVVLEGTADFDGPISGIIVNGRGSKADEAQWPVITLWTNCTVNLASALVMPAMSVNSTASYGKVIQQGATLSGATNMVGVMDPYLGACKYVLNAGAINVPKSYFCLQYQSAKSSRGKLTFEQNGGTLTCDCFNMCRVSLNSVTSETEVYRYVLNGGTLNAKITGVSGFSYDPTLSRVPDILRFDLNGGTLNSKSSALVHDEGCIFPTLGGDVTFMNTQGKTTRLPGTLKGEGSLTFAGAGAFDFTLATNFTATAISVTGGAATLSGECFTNDTAVTIAAGAKLGLDYAGTNTIRSLTLGSRLRTRDQVYGSAHRNPSYFTAAAGALKPIDGPESNAGLLLLVK